MTLVDANVLLDIAINDPKWARWSLHQLAGPSALAPFHHPHPEAPVAEGDGPRRMIQ
jgi:hypothetical protein